MCVLGCPPLTEGLLYSRRAHSSSLVCLSLTVALVTLTHEVVCVCVCVVFVLLLICVLEFLILTPSGPGRWATVCYMIRVKLCQKGICTVDRTKYVYEEATMATAWCATPPRSEGVVLTFIHVIAVCRPLHAFTQEYK